MVRVILGFILFISFFTLHANPLDSIGVEKKNGKTYIVHKIESKETLYSLSRKYGVSVDEIKAANDGLTELKLGQTILIPAKFTAASTTSSKSLKQHTVQAKETMYSISRKYDVSMDDLKKVNPGISELKVGQTINIPQLGKAADKEESKSELPDTYTVQPKETFYSISKKFSISVNEIKKLNPDVSDLKVGQILKLKEGLTINADATNIESKEEVQETRIVVERKDAPKKTETAQEKKNLVQVKEPQNLTTTEKNVPTYSNLKKDGYMKINESGLVETYPDNTGFHYALHKTAPIGTIIYVVNEENGQKVYVRVMGKLTDASPGVIMKLTPKAYEKLAQGANKVKVTATYIP